MDGFLVLDKPAGITSAKALYRFRSLSRIRKSGHAGTLDPAAEGVLVICCGRATKSVELIMNHPKVYTARARLDVTSSSFDSDAPLQAVEIARIPDREQVAAALAAQEGDLLQTPPAVSALKIGGVPAYRLERSVAEARLQPRAVQIYWLVLHDFDWPTIGFSMACSRGTYVRAVVRDLGTQLGTGGCLVGLQRTSVGPFRLADAWTLDQLEAQPVEAYILPLASMADRLRDDAISIPPRPTSR